jgi:DNA-binding winged helix-turn-helix (wHTH) protein/quercetin dioxygenase-like cupin family protein
MRAGSVAAYSFESFVLNLQRGCLQHAGVDMELRPKAFRVLQLLVEHAGSLMSKDELVALVWPDVFVSDDSLAQCVHEIRDLLGDAKQRFIKTVPRRGYIFVADVTPITAFEGKQQDVAPATASALQPHPRWLAVAGGGIAVAAFAIGAAVGPRGETADPGLIFTSGETVLGQAIAYPDDTPEVTAAIVALEPGQESGWHTHAEPIFAYVLQGELILDYGSKGVQTYRANQAVLEAVDWPHKATNRGKVPVRVLVVHLGTKGRPNTTPVAAAR